MDNKKKLDKKKAAIFAAVAVAVGLAIFAIAFFVKEKGGEGEPSEPALVHEGETDVEIKTLDDTDLGPTPPEQECEWVQSEVLLYNDTKVRVFESEEFFPVEDYVWQNLSDFCAAEGYGFNDTTLNTRDLLSGEGYSLSVIKKKGDQSSSPVSIEIEQGPSPEEYFLRVGYEGTGRFFELSVAPAEKEYCYTLEVSEVDYEDIKEKASSIAEEGSPYSDDAAYFEAVKAQQVEEFGCEARNEDGSEVGIEDFYGYSE